MRAKLGVAALVLVTAAYCWGLLWIASGFARAGGTIGWGLAAGLLILLVLTVWVTWREVLFGIRSGRLARMYRPEPAEAEEQASAADAAAEPVDPAAARERRSRAARAEFEDARTAVASGDESDWRLWFRLGLAYSANRDTRHARAAVRRAIEAERAQRA